MKIQELSFLFGGILTFLASPTVATPVPQVALPNREFHIINLTAEALLGDKVVYNFHLTLEDPSISTTLYYCWVLTPSSSRTVGGLSTIAKRPCTGGDALSPTSDPPATSNITTTTGPADSSDTSPTTDSDRAVAISWAWDQQNNIELNSTNPDAGAINKTTEAVLTLYVDDQLAGRHAVPVEDILWTKGANPILHRQIYVGPTNFTVPVMLDD